MQVAGRETRARALPETVHANTAPVHILFRQPREVTNTDSSVTLYRPYFALLRTKSMFACIFTFPC